jgi:DNA-binding MarR family transcriptional regulator
MRETKRTPAGEALTDLILDLFGLNSRMLASGDRLVAGLGLTSARWQILGAIVAADRPQPVAWLARDLGANRQNVQRIVNDLHKEGLVAFEANPHHRRAQLVVLTAREDRPSTRPCVCRCLGSTASRMGSWSRT